MVFRMDLSTKIDKCNVNEKTRKTSNTTSKQPLPKVLKAVMLGDGKVGKSAITMQFVSNIFLDFHDATIEDAYQMQYVVDNQPLLIDILDTAAQNETSQDSDVKNQNEVQTSLKEQYMRLGDCFIGVYAINDLNSFNSLRNNLNLLKRLHHYEQIPLVIVGNKVDLTNERQVSTVEGLSLAKEFECPFFEASAHDRINIEEIYTGLTRQFFKKQNGDYDSEVIKRKQPSLKRLRKFVNKKLNKTLRPITTQ